MSYSYTTTDTDTFTVTHARHLASKIAADMRICSSYYGSPGANAMWDYMEELTPLLKGRYVGEFEFGFKLNGVRIVCWQYTVDRFGVIDTDDRAGKLYSSAMLNGATFYSQLTYSSEWELLTEPQKKAILDTLPIQRTIGPSPTDGSGYWVSDRTYSAGGTGISRRTFRPAL